MPRWLKQVRRALLLLAFLALPCAAWAATPAEYKKAKNLFEYGDYKACIPLLEELVLPGRLEDEADIATAHRMLGVAYHQSGRRTEAAREFKSLLYLDPDAALDPFLTPPEVVEFFDNVKTEMSDRLPQLRELRAKERLEREQQRAAKEPLTVVEPTRPRINVVKRVRVVPWPLLFAPLGIPQFMMGHWVRGVIVLALLVLSPLPSMAFFLLARMMVGRCLPLAVDTVGGQTPQQWNIQGCNPFATANGQAGTGAGIGINETTARTLWLFFTVAQVISVFAVPVAYGMGVVDALIFPTLEIPEGETTEPAPQAPLQVPTLGLPQAPAAVTTPPSP